MQPQAAGRQRVGFGGEARRDEAGRKSARTRKHDAGINRQRWPWLEGPGGGPASLAVGRRAAMRREAAVAASAASEAEASVVLAAACGQTHSPVMAARRRREAYFVSAD